MTAACGRCDICKMLHIMYRFACERGYTCIIDSTNKFYMFSLLLSNIRKKVCFSSILNAFEMQVQDGHLF